MILAKRAKAHFVAHPADAETYTRGEAGTETRLGRVRAKSQMEGLERKLERADRLNEITQRIGFALWQLQDLESTLATYFVFVARSHKGIGLAAGNALVTKQQKKTFGTTIREMVTAGLLNAELEERFLNLLDERNWLVHRSRADSRNAVHHHSHKRQLIRRVDAIANSALVLLREVEALSGDHAKKLGLSERDIAEEVKLLLEQWHAADPI